MRTFLDLVKSFIKEFTGDKGIELYDKIWNKVKVSEFELAEDLDLTVNQTRHLLYRLHEYNLVYSIRKKDKEKGWYIYYWTFNYDHAKDLLINHKKNRLNNISKRIIELGEKEYYYCPRNHVILNVEESMEYNFKCPECEEILTRQETGNKIELLNKEIKLLNVDLMNLKKPQYINETTDQVIQRDLPGEEEPFVEKPKKPRRRKKATKKPKKIKRPKRKVKRVKRKTKSIKKSKKQKRKLKKPANRKAKKPNKRRSKKRLTKKKSKIK